MLIFLLEVFGIDVLQYPRFLLTLYLTKRIHIPLEKLADSIEDIGLLYPIIVRPTEEEIYEILDGYVHSVRIVP